jgi:hypothetical protein
MNYVHIEYDDLGKPNRSAVADLEPGEPISPTTEARGRLIAAGGVCRIIAQARITCRELFFASAVNRQTENRTFKMAV